MQLGLENKKKTMWAAALGVLAVLVLAYEFLPMLTGPSSPDSSAQAAAPAPPRVSARTAAKPARKTPIDNLDPTLRLELLAASELTQYEGNGRNIFVSQAEREIQIQKPLASGATDQNNQAADAPYAQPKFPPPPPIPLQFYGFASRPGEPKKIFLKSGDDVWVAGEGETIDRRYKVIRITPTSVEIQDVVNSGPPQNIPLTQG